MPAVTVVLTPPTNHTQMRQANVENYVNATGLMWEHAKESGALLVFAEHRFYGESWPCGGEEAAMADCLHLLTHEQAMADYVLLLAALKLSLGATGANDSPVIAFGGSYGGMLAAWLRMKYPGTIAGAISASAPILGFPGLPFYEQNGGESGCVGFLCTADPRSRVHTHPTLSPSFRPFQG
jgi:lysosomal Pro-X carboxypeptidase